MLAWKELREAYIFVLSSRDKKHLFSQCDIRTWYVCKKLSNSLPTEKYWVPGGTVQQYVVHLGTVYTVQIHCRTTDIYVYVYYHNRSWRLKQIWIYHHLFAKRTSFDFVLERDCRLCNTNWVGVVNNLYSLYISTYQHNEGLPKTQ